MVRFGAGVLAVLLTALVAAAQPALVRELGSNRFRYPGAVTQLVTSPDGKYVAAVGSAEVWVYDFATGCPVWRSPADSDEFINTFTAAFTTDNRLLRVYEDHALRVSLIHNELPSQRPLRLMGVRPKLGRKTLSPDGTLLAVTASKRVTILDTHTGREINRISKRQHDRSDFLGIDFAPDSRVLAVKFEDHAFRIFERATGHDLAFLKPRKPTRGVSFSPDGGRFTVVQEDNAVVTLDVRTGTRKTWTPKQPYDRVLGLPNDQLLGVELSRMRFDVLDAATGKVRRSFRGPPDLGEVSLTPDGKTVMVPGNDGGITLLDVATGRRLPQSADGGRFLTLRFHGMDRLSGMDEHGWTQWNLAAGTRRKIAERPNAFFSALSFDGRRLASVIGQEIRVTDTATGRVVRSLVLQPDGEIVSVWFRAQDRQIGVQTEGPILIWDIARDSVRSVPVGADMDAQPTIINSVGRWCALLTEPPSDTKTVAVLRIVDLDNKLVARTVRIVSDPSSHVRFTPDGTRLVGHAPRRPPAGWEEDVTDIPIVIEIVDPATGVCRRRFSADAPFLLDISPDGRVVLTGGYTGAEGRPTLNRVRAIEVATGRVRWELPTNQDWAVDGVGFAPDLRRVAVGTSDGVVRVWNADGDAAPPVPDAAAWDALLDADAAKGFTAVCALSAHPHVGLPLLAAKLPPEPPLDAAAVAGWVRDLDAPAFRVRQAATKSLAAVASRARPALEAALAATPSPEARERLTDLLESLTRPGPAEVRTIRAVEVVERIMVDRATSGETRRTALTLLKTWAAGADGAPLTTEAKETLDRVKK